jgi:hypothetical protein
LPNIRIVKLRIDRICSKHDSNSGAYKVSVGKQWGKEELDIDGDNIKYGSQRNGI